MFNSFTICNVIILLKDVILFIGKVEIDLMIVVIFTLGLTFSALPSA